MFDDLKNFSAGQLLFILFLIFILMLAFCGVIVLLIVTVCKGFPANLCKASVIVCLSYFTIDLIALIISNLIKGSE